MDDTVLGILMFGGAMAGIGWLARDLLARRERVYKKVSIAF